MKSNNNNSQIIKLPRGGYILDNDYCYIQFGSPPETIKDTMKMPKGVPQIFVLPCDFFNWLKGISVAEMEFPIYYNFFLKNKKTLIICHEEQIERFNTLLYEALFGPKNFDLKEDYTFETEMPFPDIKKEVDYFRRDLNIDNLVEFKTFQNNKVEIEGVIINHKIYEDFNVILKNNNIINIPSKIDYVPKYDIGQRLAEPYHPPLFGITCLGPSHGFDPEENTSGFIIWLNHRGIMVDPPVNSTEWLTDSNVNPKFIDSIILTHCHADHDAGTFQKILEESKVNIYTTETIKNSFLKKYSALTDVSSDYLARLFTFNPVKIDRPLFIHGGRFDFFYSLHSIPTIGFKLFFQQKTFVYSSDHNNDSGLHKKLLDEKIINEKRYNELQNFPWDSDVIYHESGFQPLHTPINILKSLPDKIKKKVVVYHISKKDFPKDESLRLAKFGIENTLNINVKAGQFENTYQVLGLLNYLDFFDNMTISKAMEFINIVKEEKFKKGNIIIKKGTIGDKFYIIHSGNILVTGDALIKRKIYGACDYFGERALVTGNKRAADVIAETDVIVYTIEKDKFLYFISGTDFEKTLIKLAKTRDSESWNVLSNSKIFGILTSTQKTILESMIYKIERKDPGIIIKEGDIINEIYIIRHGKVRVLKEDKEIANLGRGDFIGSMFKIHREEQISFTFTHDKPVSLYAISKNDVIKFLDKNPGLIMKLTYDF